MIMMGKKLEIKFFTHVFIIIITKNMVGGRCCLRLM